MVNVNAASEGGLFQDQLRGLFVEKAVVNNGAVIRKARNGEENGVFVRGG